MKRFYLFGILLLSGTIFFGVFQVLAQELSVGIAISPLVFEITGNPGETIENQVKITNRFENTIDIKITIEDIAPSDEAGHVIVEPAETESYSVAKWIQLSQETFTLGPGQSQWIPFKMIIPENAEPGGHYGTIVAAGTVITGGQVTGTIIVPRVGTLILASVPGEITEHVTVTEFTAPGYSEQGPITFGVKFENLGSVHVKPKGVITVTNWFGQKVAEIPLPERNILPQAVRKIEATWDHKWLWAGKYTATITGSYGINNSQLSPVVIGFWAFPWKAGVIILIVFILLLLARKRFMAAFKILLKGEK